MYVFKEAVVARTAVKSKIFSIYAIAKHIDLNSLSCTFICIKCHFRPAGNGSVECCTNYFFNGNVCTGMGI